MAKVDRDIRKASCHILLLLEGSLPCSQKLVIRSHQEPNNPSQVITLYFFEITTILESQISPFYKRALPIRIYNQNIVRIYRLSKCTTHPTLLTLPNLITPLRAPEDEYRLWSYSVIFHNSLFPVWRPTILFGASFSDTFDLWAKYKVYRNDFSHKNPHITIVVYSILIFKLPEKCEEKYTIRRPAGAR